MNEKGRISSLSRIEQWQRKKEEKNREKIENDEKNVKRASSARQHRQKNRGERSVKTSTRHSIKAVHKVSKQCEKREKRIEEERERMEKIRAQTRERVRKLRLKKKASQAEFSQASSGAPVYSTTSSAAFPKRMAKVRAFQKVSNALPESPEKKAEVVERIAQNPTTKGVLQLKGIINTRGTKRVNNTASTGSRHC